MCTGAVRFRVESDTSGVGPPLYEHQTLAEAEIGQGQRVVMEQGPPPLSTEVCMHVQDSCQS